MNQQNTGTTGLFVRANKQQEQSSLDFSIQQLAAIRQAILATIDDQRYDLYEGKWMRDDDSVLTITESMADEARLRFCDAVQGELTDMVAGEAKQ